MKKTFYTLIATSFILSACAVQAEDTVFEEHDKPTVSAPVPADLNAIKENKADETKTKAPLSKEEKIDKIIEVGIGKVAGKENMEKLGEDNTKLAVSAVKTGLSGFSVEGFKNAKAKAAAKAQEELETRTAQGLTNSDRRKFWTGVKYGTWEGVKIVAKATWGVVTEHGVNIALALI